MKKILFLLLVLCPKLFAQSSLEKEVIIFGIISPYGQLEAVKNYFLLEPSDSIDSNTISVNGRNYRVFPFEIATLGNSLAICCNDQSQKNVLIDENGEPDYNTITKKSFKKRIHKQKYVFAKLMLEYCKCPSFYSKPEIKPIYCFPKKIISYNQFKRREKKEFKKNIESLIESSVIKSFL